MAKPIPGQLAVPTPNEIGTRHNPDAAYEQTFGVEKAREQAALYRLNHACNCGRKKNHALGCPKAKRPRLSGMSVTVYGVPQPAGSKP